MNRKASQDTPDSSAAAFWINHVGTGVWRTAHKAHICDDRDCAGVHPGDRYLDTGERISVWRTHKLCEAHAIAHDADGPWPKPAAPLARSA